MSCASRVGIRCGWLARALLVGLGALSADLGAEPAVEAWRSAHFGASANSGVAANDADPDWDGLPNFFEYAVGGDPLSAASTNSLLPSLSGRSLRVEFPRFSDRAGVAYHLQSSSDLKTWCTEASSWGGAALATSPAVSVIEVGSAPVNVTAVDNAAPAAGASRFFRLRVSRGGTLTGENCARLFTPRTPGLTAESWQPEASGKPVIAQSGSSAFANATQASLYTGTPADFVNLESAVWVVGSGYPNDLCLAPTGLDSTNSVMPGAFEFQTGAADLEMVFKREGGSPYLRIWVDGQLVTSPNGLPVEGTPGSFPRFVRLTFPHAASRRIRVESYLVRLSALRFPVGGGGAAPGYSAANRPPRVIIVGDSYTEGTGALGTWRGFALSLRQKFGWDTWMSGSGGTGYLNPGPNGRKKLRDRVQTDIIRQNPDLVIIAGGTNDGGYGEAALYSEAGLLYDEILSALPNTRIVVVGPWWPNASAVPGLGEVRAGIKAAAEARGLPFIDPTEPGNFWITAANKQSYHPTIAAAGKAQVSGGSVVSLSVTNGGSGYDRVPAVTFTGGGGTGATATALVDGRVFSVTPLAGGRGYASAPTVEIVNAPGDTTGSGATAVASVSEGSLTGITVTNQGAGYTCEPRVSLVGGGGCGAAGVAGFGYVVIGATVSAPGVGYVSAPSVSFSAPSDGTHPSTAGHAYYAARLAWELQQLAGFDVSVVGVSGIPVKAGSDSIVSVPLGRPGAVKASIAGATTVGTSQCRFDLATDAGFAVNALAAGGYVRLLSGAKRGMDYEIVANTSGSVTIDSHGDNLSPVAPGDLVEIGRYWTLATLFPTGQSGTAVNPLVASASTSPLARKSQLLMVPPMAAGINLAASRAFYFTASHWYAAATNQIVDNEPIYPEQPIIIRQPLGVGDRLWSQVGSVWGGRFTTPLTTTPTSAQDNWVALPRALSLRLDQLGLESAFVASPSTSPLHRRDQLFVFDNSKSGYNKSAARVYYRTAGTWRRAGADALNAGGETFPPAAGMIVRKFRTASGASSIWNQDSAQ